MSYADDLKHPLWQRCRLRVLETAGWRCSRCGDDDRQLHAHHKAYIRGRRPWEYPLDMLECLCDECHSKAHAERDLLDLAIAKRPTSEVPALTRLVGRVTAVLTADSPQQRVDAMNALQDELDCIEDDRRVFPAIEQQEPHAA